QVILAGRRINDNMGVYIANSIIKLMVRNEIKVKSAKILVLGITFKENCPDVRNSKVIDVIEELESFGLMVDTYDPYANKDQVKKHYGLELLDEINQKYEAIVLAVGHKQFLNLNINDLKSSSDAIIYDIKSFLPKDVVTKRL